MSASSVLSVPETCRPAGMLTVISPSRSVPSHTGSECSLPAGRRALRRRPVRDQVVGAGHSQPDGGMCGADAAPGYLRYPRQDLLQRDRPGEAAAQVSQGLVRRGPASVDGPVAQPLHPTPQRLERHATRAVATTDAQYSSETRPPTSAPAGPQR